MSHHDVTPEDLRENTEVLEVSNRVFDPNSDRSKGSVCFFFCLGALCSSAFLWWGDKPGPRSNTPCSLIAAITKNRCVGRNPGEDGVIFKKFFVMAFPLHCGGNSEDALCFGMNNNLILDGMALLLSRVEVGLTLGDPSGDESVVPLRPQ